MPRGESVESSSMDTFHPAPPLGCTNQKGKAYLPGSTINAHSPFTENTEHLPGALKSKKSLSHDLKTIAGYIFKLMSIQLFYSERLKENKNEGLTCIIKETSR